MRKNPIYKFIFFDSLGRTLPFFLSFNPQKKPGQIRRQAELLNPYFHREPSHRCYGRKQAYVLEILP